MEFPLPATKDRKVLALARWQRLNLIRVNFGAQFFKKLEQESIYGKVSSTELSKFKKKKYMIYPDYKIKKLWDFLIALLVFYFAIMVPYRIGFDAKTDGAWLVSELLFDTIFMIDIILRMFLMAYQDDVHIVDDWKVIAKNYLTGWFCIDLVSTFPFYIMSGSFFFAKLGRLLRLPKLFRINRLLTVDIDSQVGRFSRFITALFLTTHIFACFWHYIWSFSSKESEMSYITSVYFILTTFTSVGFGDISPQTTSQIIFVIVAQFVGMSFYGYLLGAVTSMIQAMTQQQQSKLEQIELWLVKLDEANPSVTLSQKLQTEIMDYFHDLWAQDCSFMKKIIQYLPHELKFNVLQHIYGDLFEFFDNFFGKSEQEFRNEFVLKLMPRNFEAEEFIIKTGQEVQQVFLIMEGSAIFTYQTHPFLLLPKRSFFGEHYILLQCIPVYDIKAGVEGLQSVAISKEGLMELLERYIQAKEYLEEIANERKKHFMKLFRTCLENFEKPENIESLCNEEKQDEQKQMHEQIMNLQVQLNEMLFQAQKLTMTVQLMGGESGESNVSDSNSSSSNESHSSEEKKKHRS